MNIEKKEFINEKEVKMNSYKEAKNKVKEIIQKNYMMDEDDLEYDLLNMEGWERGDIEEFYEGLAKSYKDLCDGIKELEEIIR